MVYRIELSERQIDVINAALAFAQTDDNLDMLNICFSRGARVGSIEIGDKTMDEITSYEIDDAKISID